ncbi:hypothetical protein HpBT018_02420 [Helicobacter pylori]
MDLKIRYKEVSKGLKELSKTLIVYPFEKHVEALEEQCSKIVFIPINNNNYSNICTFVSNFKNLIDSYNQLKPFLHFYKELIKYVSGNSELIKNFCQCVREIIECNTPNKNHKTNQFFIIGKNRQNQLAKFYSRFKKLSENEVKTKDVEYISNKIKSLDEIFKTTGFNKKFTPKTEVKDIIKEIDEKYPINENFKQQFEEFESNIKNLDEMKKDFERKKSC